MSKEITLQKIQSGLRNGYTFTELLSEVEQFEPIRPEKPTKPILKIGAKAKEVKDYALKLESYESKLVDYKRQFESYQKEKIPFNKLMREAVEDYAGIEVVPQKYRSKLWNLAWEQGHSSGYHDVYNYLLDLIDIFE